MKTLKTWIVVLLSVMFAVHAHGGDKYEVQDPRQLKIEVKGVVCSFCAYGTEKNLSRLDFVDQNLFGGDGVLLDLENALIILSVQPDRKIDFRNIVKAIEKGGYVATAIHIKFTGPVVKQNQDLFVQNDRNGQLFRLLDTDGQTWKGERYLGEKLSIQGFIPATSVENENSSETPAVRIKKLKMAMGESLQKGEMKMEVINLKVSGMHCSGCVSNVEATLKSVLGVHSVDVNLDQHRATVEVEAGKVKPGKLIETIEKGGRFQASLVKEKQR